MSITISFFSNFFNAHQLPVARELDANPSVDYAFVAMQRVEGLEGRACLNDDYPFVIKQYLGGLEAEEAMAHAVGDDIVVFGDMAGDESYVRARAETGKPFFRYSERLLKRGDWWAYVPPKRYRTYDRFTRYKDNPMYVLCASGYTARDLGKFGFPVKRCLKWGYFPQVDSSPVEARRLAGAHGKGAQRPQRALQADHRRERRGGTPFLIDPGVDGVIFRSEDARELADAVAALLDDPGRLEVVARAGTNKVCESWSAKSAAGRLVEASERLLADSCLTPFEDDGPLSLAGVIDENWYLK